MFDYYRNTANSSMFKIQRLGTCLTGCLDLDDIVNDFTEAETQSTECGIDITMNGTPLSDIDSISIHKAYIPDAMMAYVVRTVETSMITDYPVTVVIDNVLSDDNNSYLADEIFNSDAPINITIHLKGSKSNIKYKICGLVLLERMGGFLSGDHTPISTEKLLCAARDFVRIS